MICFGTEATNVNAERLGREILHSFFDQLNTVGLLHNRLMWLRVELVFDVLLRLALDRNEEANGETIEFVIHTVGKDGVILTVKDCGGKAACISRKHVDEYVDSINFELVNGGLLSRALFKWKTC